MMKMDEVQLLHTITLIAEEAGVLAHTAFALSEKQVTQKNDGSPVTSTDLEINTYIREALLSRTPHKVLLSEEQEQDKSNASVYWVVDPIDGTSNFIQGVPAYTISIALLKEGIVNLGVVYAPSLGVLYTGLKNGGATRNGISIQASFQESLSGAKILLDHGSHMKTIDFHKEVRTSLETAESLVTSTECASLELCRVADGSADGFIHRGLHAWDIAAGMLIAEEAGAVITDLRGNPKLLFESGIIASATNLSQSLVSVTKKALDEEARRD